MPSIPDPSNNEGHKRRGVVFICGLFLRVLMMGGALLLGLLFSAESLAAHGRIGPTGSPAFSTPQEKPGVKWLPEATGAHVLKLTPPGTSELRVSLLVADLEVPTTSHTIPAVLAPTSQLPAPPMGLDGPPAKKKIVVHTGLFGGAAGPFPTKRPVEKVQTGVFGSFRGFSDRAQGENPGSMPK